MKITEWRWVQRLSAKWSGTTAARQPLRPPAIRTPADLAREGDSFDPALHDPMPPLGEGVIESLHSPETAVRVAEQMPGFERVLRPAEQRAVRALLGLDHPMGVRARAVLMRELREPSNRERVTPASQANTLVGLLRNPEIPDERTEDLFPAPRRTPDPFSWGSPKQLASYGFLGEWTPATEHTLHIGEQTVVIVAKREWGDGAVAQKRMLEGLASDLAELHSTTRAVMPKLVLQPQDDPGSEMITERWAGQERSAVMATMHDGTLSIFPQEPYDGLSDDRIKAFLHELDGHLRLVQEWGPVGTTLAWDRFAQAAVDDGIQLSRYGTMSVRAEGTYSEQGAEAGAVYRGTRGTSLHAAFRDIWPNQFARLDEAYAKDDARAVQW